MSRTKENNNKHLQYYNEKIHLNCFTMKKGYISPTSMHLNKLTMTNTYAVLQSLQTDTTNRHFLQDAKLMILHASYTSNREGCPDHDVHKTAHKEPSSPDWSPVHHPVNKHTTPTHINLNTSEGNLGETCKYFKQSFPFRCCRSVLHSIKRTTSKHAHSDSECGGIISTPLTLPS